MRQVRREREGGGISRGKRRLIGCNIGSVLCATANKTRNASLTLSEGFLKCIAMASSLKLTIKEANLSPYALSRCKSPKGSRIA